MLAEHSNEIVAALAAGLAFNGGIGLWVLKTLSNINTRLAHLEGRLSVKARSSDES